MQAATICTTTRTRQLNRVARTLALAAIAMLLAGVRTHAATVDQDPLQYARGFLITGNYVVGGVDLTPQLNVPVNGLATGTIPMSGVPANVDIVGAFLYWEAIYAPGAQPTAGAQFRGVALDATVAWPTTGVPGLNGTTWPAALPGNNTSTCWGSANGAGSQLTMFRADVMRLLPKLFDANGDWTGRYLVNDSDLTVNKDANGQIYSPHTVTLPETSGNHAVQSAGATLVVIYRNPAEPLTKVVLYDGAYAQAQGNAMAQTLRAFYQHAGSTGKMTPIVGSGGPNNKTELFFNGSLVTLNPFPSTSPSSDRSWNFPTLSPLPMGNLSGPPALPNGPGFYDGYGETATMGVDHTNASPYDCLSLAAIVFSTPVLDADNDGLPDALEASSTAGGSAWRNPDIALSVTDPGRLLPNLHGMGASPNQKDLFVEIGAMLTTGPLTYGSASAPFDSSNPNPASVMIGAHTHLPGPDALKMLGDVYFGRGIVPHFDVGNTAAYLASSYPGNGGCAFNNGQWTPDPVCQYLVPYATDANARPSLARGGETVVEKKCVPADLNNPYATCRFYDYPGTIGWKFGFEAFRDAPVDDSGTEITSQAQLQAWYAGTAPYTSQRRRFDSQRRQFFHYVMYGHAQGRSKSLPCIVNGHPADYDVNGTCSTSNPYFVALDYNVPSSSSGVSDLPGNSAMITLGLWDKVSGTGTTFNQASTTLHELGHNLELSHGGGPTQFGSKFLGTLTKAEPNCKPNYFSSMSYLFQAHGLIDAAGDQHLDYSGSVENTINENSLADSAFAPTPTYQPTWFAPSTSALATLVGASQASRSCNGVKVTELTVPDPQLARVWAPVPSPALDWNVAVDWLGDDPSNPTGSGFVANVNFDAVFNGGQTFSDALSGWNDWANIRLNQLGAAHGVGRSVVGPQFDASSGDLAFDCPGCGDLAFDCPGCGEVAFDCPGCGDLAYDCPGCGDVAFDCPGCGDLAYDCPGCGEVAFDCPGCGDLAFDCPGCGGPRDIDFTTAKGMGKAAPPSFKACILGAVASAQGCRGAWTGNDGVMHASQPSPGDPMYHRVYTTWKIPSVDTAKNYVVYRQRGATISANWKNTAVQVGSPTITSAVDTEELPNGLSFTYFAVAVYDGGPSGVSAFRLIANIINDAPTATADSYLVPKNGKLTRTAAQGVLSNDQDDDSPKFTSTNPPQNGRGVAVLISGPANASKNGFTLNPDGSFSYSPRGGFTGGDSFTYVANDGKWQGDTTVALSPNSAVTTVTLNVQ
jgi:hypothetical protein